MQVQDDVWGGFVESRLMPVNALLGLVLDGQVNPAPLAHAGYDVAGLEVPIASPANPVTIDVLFANGATGHLIAGEAKSGRNVEIEQARRYRALDPAAVVHAAHVTVRQRPTVDVVYACLAEHAERISRGLDEAEAPFPILVVHRDKIVLERAERASPPIRRLFGEMVALVAPPVRFLPFDHDSPVAVLKPSVKAALVGLLARRIPYISLAGLTEAAMPHYVLFSRKAQGKLRRKVADAARELAAEAPESFEFHPLLPNRDGKVRLLRTPEDYDPRGRTQAYQALARGPRRKPRHVDPDQFDLLEELDRADRESDTVGGEREDGDRTVPEGGPP